MRKRAKELGMRLNEYGLFDETGEKIAGDSETDIFKVLGIGYVHYEERSV
jgi:DNA polymerase/3'-5' exonuclease PolX